MMLHMDIPPMYSYQDLRALGYSRRGIQKLLSIGVLIRLGRDTYVEASTPSTVTAAIRRGARLGCLSGCSIHGLWTPPDPDTHIVYGTGHKPLPRAGTQIHRYGTQLPKATVWAIEDCIAQVCLNHDPETALIVLESAIYNRHLRYDDALVILMDMPKKLRWLGPYVNGGAMSGSETRVRFFLERRGVSVQTQVHISGVGPVDTVAGNSLIIECDSDAHHSSQRSYERDRARDLAARLLGYETLRLSYRQIWHEWEATQQSILTLIRTRRHYSKPY